MSKGTKKTTGSNRSKSAMTSHSSSSGRIVPSDSSVSHRSKSPSHSPGSLSPSPSAPEPTLPKRSSFVKWRQLQALIWKDFKLRTKSPISSLIEIFLIFGLLLAFSMIIGSDESTKGSSRSETVPVTHYKEEFSLIHSGSEISTIYYCPDDQGTKDFMKLVSDTYSSYNENRALSITGFASENEMLDHAVKSDKEVTAALIFTETSGNLRYTLRPESSRKIDTSRPHEMNKDSYFKGVSQVQFLVNEAFIRKEAKSSGVNMDSMKTGDIKLHYDPPLHSSRSGQFERGGSTAVVSAMIVFGSLYFFGAVVKRVTIEKKNGNRDMFTMMGLTDGVYWASILISNFIVTFFGSIMISWILLGFPGGPTYVKYSNIFIIFIFVNLYFITIILNGCLLSIPFNRPILAQIVSTIYFALSYAVTLAFSYSRSDAFFFDLTSWLPNPNLGYFALLLNDKEGDAKGVLWGNLNDKDSNRGNISVGGLMMTQVLSILMNMLLIWYLDKVWPWQSGIVQSPWFFATTDYWCPSHVMHIPDKNDKQADPKYFEEEDSKQKAVTLNNVTKQYGWTGKPSVDNITFSIYRDQITCLLGHNGAGKTTTMSMITGVFHPTKGKINVNGYDLLTQTTEARRSMSLCPQHNPLYDSLTVNEHLTLFGAIKGYPWSDLSQEVKRTVEAVTLVGHEKKQAQQLSGGMKRKLCLGIALIGGTEVVVLDEPTSGLDTEARRSIWDSLRKIRKNKTILLSTHDMEEADALGDRVIIMATGTLLCAGSTQFLRKAYDAGYSLKIAKGSNFNQSQVEGLLKSSFPNFKLKAQVGTEISFNLGNTEGKKPPLPDFFRQLENKKSELGIESFGLSVTTMEDIFLKAGDLHEGKPPSDGHRSLKSSIELTSEKNLVRATGSALNWHRAYGLFVKRCLFARRYLPVMITQIMVPAVVLCLAFLAVNEILVSNKDTHKGRMELGTNNPSSEVFLVTDPNNPAIESNLKSYCTKVGCRPKILDKGEDIASYFDKLIKNQPQQDPEHMIGLEVKTSSNERQYNAWISNDAKPLAIDMIYKILDMEISKKDSSRIETTIESLPPPIPRGEVEGHDDVKYIIIDVIWGILLPIVFPPLASAFILYPIHENASKAKLVQMMTGLHPFLYHFIHFLFDNLVNIIGSILLIAMIYFMDTESVIRGNVIHTISMFILLIFFGIACVPFAYIFSFLFMERVSGYAGLNGIYILTGIMFGVLLLTFELLAPGAPGPSGPQKSIAQEVTEWVARVFPTYSASRGFRTIYLNGALSQLCEPETKYSCPKEKDDSKFAPCCPNLCHKRGLCFAPGFPLGWNDNEIGKELFMMAATGLVSLLVLTACEMGIMGFIGSLFSSRGQPVPVIPEKDVDLEKTRVDQMVQNKTTDQDALITHNLRKNFGSKFVVNGISFGVHKSEIFGLLGVNGAGKTTTFSMITGDLVPTSGETYQGSQSISVNRSKFQEELGYCPQFDPILDKLTGREMLFLFGRLRGIGGSDLPNIVNQILGFIDLRPHEDKRTETYSGGNKRKLSLGLALIGRPKVLLLDEPTAGVDPGARRKIWNTLNEAKIKFNCSVVLTSHSMDECEALCSRVAIMVAGQFRCLGSSQHLKSTYGQGYTITIKFDRKTLTDSAYVAKVTAKVNGAIQGAYVADKHEKVIVYRTKDNSTRWDQLFSAMDSINDEFKFEDYTISDTTLEQIFIAFARNKQDDH